MSEKSPSLPSPVTETSVVVIEKETAESSAKRSQNGLRPQKGLRSQKGLRPMERAMIGMAGFYLGGVLIFGFLTGPVRGIAMMLFVMAFTWFIFSPMCTRDQVTKSVERQHDEKTVDSV